MAASLEADGILIPVKLRNLSSEGALIEGDSLPAVATWVIFRKKELKLAGQVAWVTAGRAGIAFVDKLDREAVLRHVPATRPPAKVDCRRPGLKSGELSAGERKMAQDWIWGEPLQNLGD